MDPDVHFDRFPTAATAAKPRRKDFGGLPELIDRRATLSLFRFRKSPLNGVSLTFFRRILVSIISGSVRARDRLHAAGLIPPDACERDGCRHTTRHLWWECTRFKGLRKEYTDYIERVQAVADKYGNDVGNYIRGIRQNNAFLHTGVVAADEDAAKWAAGKGTECNPGIDHPDYLKIRSNPKTLWVTRNGRVYVAVFTDGSAQCTSSEWLSHGGWGVYTPGAEHNTAGHLSGVPCTSYRAEGRAILDAITRAAEPICIICDNLAAVNNLKAIIANLGEKETWRSNDECADFWQAVAKHIKANPDICPIAEWLPSHMDDPQKAHVLQDFLARDGSLEWVEGS